MKKTDRPYAARLNSRGATHIFQTDNICVSKIQAKYFSPYIKESAKLRNTAESIQEDKCVRKNVDSAVTDLCMMKL